MRCHRGRQGLGFGKWQFELCNFPVQIKIESEILLDADGLPVLREWFKLPFKDCFFGGIDKAQISADASRPVNVPVLVDRDLQYDPARPCIFFLRASFGYLGSSL